MDICVQCQEEETRGSWELTDQLVYPSGELWDQLELLTQM